jgi:hypothetical protein
MLGAFAVFAAGPVPAADLPVAREWDFQRETAVGQGLSTGDVAEIRLLVEPERGLRVVLSQIGTDTTRTASFGNDLDLEVLGPEGRFLGHLPPGEVTRQAGALPEERVELAPKDVVPGVWTVRVYAAWVPMGPEGYRLAVAGDVQEIIEAGVETVGAELSQNDPNPVRDRTTIRFTLSRAGDILLGVYDIAGRPVRTLASGSQAAGIHTAAWNGRDAAGDRVAPGIYFYRLEGSGFDLTRKLVVVR